MLSPQSPLINGGETLLEYPLPLWERARVRGKSVFRTKTYSRNCQTLGVPQQSWGFIHYYNLFLSLIRDIRIFVEFVFQRFYWIQGKIYFFCSSAGCF